MEEKKRLYPNLRAELARNGLNIKDLAEKLGMTHQNAYNKINGKIVFNEKDMRTIQEYLKAVSGNTYTLDYLFESGK